VDTMAEKQTRTMLRQKCTVPETHYHGREKKSETRVATEKLGEAEVLFVVFLFFWCGIYCAREMQRTSHFFPFFYKRQLGLGLGARPQNCSEVERGDRYPAGAVTRART
jgi:hypothetical protein